MRGSNYYIIQFWMINELKLKGIQLQLYAIIYGFSQDGESAYTGGLAYLCKFTGATKPTIIKALAALENQGLIKKDVININNVKYNKYYCVDNKNYCVDNKKNNEKDYKTVKKDIFESYANGNDKLYCALKAFEQHRKKMRKPLTDRAKQLILKKLCDKNPDEQIRLIDKAIEFGWLTVYDDELDNIAKTQKAPALIEEAWCLEQ